MHLCLHLCLCLCLQVVCEKGKTAGFESVLSSGGTHASFRVVGAVVKSPAKGQVRAGLCYHAVKVATATLQRTHPPSLCNAHATDLLSCNITLARPRVYLLAFCRSALRLQAIELHASSIACIGGVADPASYPLSKKKHSPEFLRDLLHLRPRTNLIGAGA